MEVEGRRGLRGGCPARLPQQPGSAGRQRVVPPLAQTSMPSSGRGAPTHSTDRPQACATASRPGSQPSSEVSESVAARTRRMSADGTGGCRLGWGWGTRLQEEGAATLGGRSVAQPGPATPTTTSRAVWRRPSCAPMWWWAGRRTLRDMRCSAFCIACGGGVGVGGAGGGGEAAIRC